MKLKVRRGAGHERNSPGVSGRAPSQPVSHYDTFVLDAPPGATVLSLLFEARDRFDDSLAFRYACRGAVCGSCGMLINKVPRLACRTQVALLLAGRAGVELGPDPGIEEGERWNAADEVLVEPLPHLPVLKDLVVDMTRFFRFLRIVEPVLHAAAAAPEHEYRMEPAAARELERYTNCILCGACYGACPVCGEDPGYFGPAALAQLYRFHIDPREARDGSRLALADGQSGWWACRFYANCRDVCPKGVTPNLAIGRARQELKPKVKTDAEN